MQIEASEKILYKDGIQDEYALAEKKLELLKREIAALEADKELISGDPSVARDRLLQKVKEDNARMSEVEKRIKEVDEEILKRRQYSDELSKEMNERKGEAGDPVKYEALFKRDAEVTEFVDRYPQMREKELAEHRKLQVCGVDSTCPNAERILPLFLSVLLRRFINQIVSLICTGINRITTGTYL